MSFAAGHGAFALLETDEDLLEITDVIERSRRGVNAWVELVEVPAKPADHAGSLSDQVFAMVNEKPDLPVFAVESCGRQIGFALCRPIASASIGSDLP